MTHRFTSRQRLACLLALAAATPLADAGLPPVAAGQKATLRVEFDLVGKEDGKPIHRTVIMVAKMESAASADGEDLDGESAAAYDAARPQREQALAGARTRLDKIDMDAVARACDRDRDSAECQAGQKAFAETMAQADTAMRIGAKGPDPANKDRLLVWTATADHGEACGTIEGRLLDPGKPAAVTRLPKAGDVTAAMNTCLHQVFVDRKKNQVLMSLSAVAVQRPDKQDQGYYLIEAIDFAGNRGATFDAVHGTLVLRGLPFQVGRPAGTVSYRGERGVTTVKWSLEPR